MNRFQPRTLHPFFKCDSPAATNVFVIAEHYGFWVDRASACIPITKAVSVVSITVLLYAMTSGSLPPDLLPAWTPPKA